MAYGIRLQGKGDSWFKGMNEGRPSFHGRDEAALYQTAEAARADLDLLPECVRKHFTVENLRDGVYNAKNLVQHAKAKLKDIPFLKNKMSGQKFAVGYQKNADKLLAQALRELLHWWYPERPFLQK